MSGLSSSISVTVRVRPFTIREAAQITRIDDTPSFFGDGSLAGTPKPQLTNKGIRRVIKVVDENVLVFDPPEENPMAKFQKSILGPQGKKTKDMKFGFDRIFDENASQMEVYENTSRNLLDSVLDGYNSTVFAYGATGCGKTHTISGTKQHPGIIFLTMEELFARIEELRSEKTIELSLSYLEIYNETIRDLLVPGGNVKGGLQLREDSKQTISVSGLSTHKPRNVEEVMEMIVTGNTNRTMSPTEANATSSRSHAVLQVNVVQKNKTAGLSEDHMAATLSIIDLAGSERASVTKNRGERLLEGANINRSLLALGNCINALCDPSKRNHVPYRDSKLTRLLKFSLGGNCKTVMIVCVSPASCHYDETHNTLKYADRAKNIKTKVSRNMINVNRHVSQYVKAIFDLQNEVADLKKRLTDATKVAMEKLTKQQAGRDMAMKEGIRRIRAAFDVSNEKRKRKLKFTLSIRLMDRRIATLKAWTSAFDEMFGDNGAPESLNTIRQSANDALRELERNKRALENDLAQEQWDSGIDQALRTSTQNLMGVNGSANELDVEALTREAHMLKAAGERDILTDVLSEEADASVIEQLTKAHFQAIMDLGRIRNMSAEEAAVDGALALSNVIQVCTDATGQVVKPNGELIGIDTNIPTPKKKRTGGSSAYFMSPVKKITTELPMSPTRGTPRSFKVGTPGRRGVSFLRKPSPKKKSVRWHEDVEDNEGKSKQHKVVEPQLQPVGRTLFPEASSAAAASGDLASDLVASSSQPTGPSRPPVQIHTDAGLDEPARRPAQPAPPVRNSRMAIGFLSNKPGSDDANYSSSPEQQGFIAAIARNGAQGSTGSPLREVELGSFVNRNSFDNSSGSSLGNNGAKKPANSRAAAGPPGATYNAQGNTTQKAIGNTSSSSTSHAASNQSPPESEGQQDSNSPNGTSNPKPRYVPAKLSAPVQIKLKPAVRHSLAPNASSAAAAAAAAAAAGSAAERSSFSGSFAATTAAQRAKRRSPPPRSPEGNKTIGNGPRRNVKPERDSNAKPVALSPRSSSLIMKASSSSNSSTRRLSLTINDHAAEQMLQMASAAAAGTGEGMSAPPIR